MDLRPEATASQRLGEAVMAALAELSADRPGLVVPPGIPVREGRFSVGTLLDRLRGELRAVAGFAIALWVGPADVSPPVVRPMPTQGERAPVVERPAVRRPPPPVMARRRALLRRGASRRRWWAHAEDANYTGDHCAWL